MSIRYTPRALALIPGEVPCWFGLADLHYTLHYYKHIYTSPDTPVATLTKLLQATVVPAAFKPHNYIAAITLVLYTVVVDD